MKNVLLQTAMKLNKNRKHKKSWQRVVRALTMVVVFCTTYALILPAITMQAEPVCGMEEHAHTDACYSQQETTGFVCGLSADVKVVHQHDAYCLDASGNLICPLAEASEHVHDDSCYTQSETLNCPVTHVHNEECAKAEKVLSCTLQETEAHIHGEGCSEEQNVQVCTIPEGHTHGEGCYALQTVTVCTLEESESHAHGDGCWEEQTVQVCTIPEGHTHGEGCYALQTVMVCTLEETEGHAHGEGCYTVQETSCSEPTAEGHEHTADCYQQTTDLTCGKEVLQLHTHGETCYDAEGTLVCTLPQVVAHSHSDSCIAAEQAEPVLICTLAEHTHEDSCYPVEGEAALGLEYRCGYSVHSHNENCYALDGTLTCTIPAHSHEAACVLEDLDLTADVELASEWEAELDELEFTGVWAEDLLTVAESQLGYQESKKNCILKDDQLLGYTRYADWYGEYYGEWDDMFVAFCLNYAEITEEYVPRESDTAKWIEALTEEELYAAAGDDTPVAGDLIFWDSDDDEEADKSGIVKEINEENQIEVIAGDTENDCVETLTFELDDDTIVGYCKLPASPMSAESWAEAEEVAAMLEALPNAQTAEAALQLFNESGEKAGYEALRQELVSRVEAAQTAYDALTEEQKAMVGSTDNLEALRELCGGDNWQQFAALEEDGAVITSLTVDGAEVIRAEQPAAEETAEETAEEEQTASEETVIPDNMVRSQDVIRYTFTAAAESYYTDVSYGEANVKVELVLPLTQDKAAFDTEAMTWLENQTLTTETRTINDTETSCQVLTGYKKLVADETSGIVVPGSFTETAVVKVLNMTHGEQVALIISTAMEHGTWEGTCETHQVAEKLTVAASAFSAYAPASTEEQQTNYEAFLLRIEELAETGMNEEDVQALLLEITEAYYSGGLSAEQYEALAALISPLSEEDLANIAEPWVGTNWLTRDRSIETVYGAESVALYSFARTASVAAQAALTAEVAETVFASAAQIDREGGENTSSDGAVYVSKTIEGTDTENVFDITLEIITQDVIDEIYKDPNMAVVVVMDVSNTMKSDFEDGDKTTRYDAAVAAASDFMKQFATQNSTLSQLGFVAFNTHAHKIFDMSPCNTTAQANALISEMVTDTQAIMDAYGSGDKNRFTNMEAGLKMARDMLEDAPNTHKYVIFITDGFPTTYISSGYTGYNPYNTTSSSDGDTRDTYGTSMFYDKVFNKYITYGTSYSDTAAIKARQMATAMKNDDISIFSIGVDLSGQTLSFYNRHSYYGSGFSVVERMKSKSYYNSTGYEIGLKHSDLWDPSDVPPESADDYDPADYPEWEAYKPQEAAYFKTWLTGSSTNNSVGIGSGYYYDSNDSDGLSTAFDQIFEKIKELNASSSHLDWVATDPMPDMGVHEVQAMEFIGFWDKDGNLVDKLVGESADGEEYENTADYHTDTATIHWDLKNSGYISQTMNNTTNYYCSLKYRVRLKNEESVFVENQIYNTNDVTTLTYRVIETDGTTTTISEQRTVSFPIPAVHGFISELNFKKTDPSGNPVAGAEFTLSHDTANCGNCRNGIQTEGAAVSQVPLTDLVVTSDQNGLVSFTNIPSGHIYKLTETVVPDGFIWNGNTYRVAIAYDAQTLLICDENGNVLLDDEGNPVQWTTGTVENDMYYELPHTGSTGTSHFTFGGLLMIAAALMYSTKFGRKQRKGGAHGK